MKKLLLTALFAFWGATAFAQVSFTGNPEYGRMQNFVYDKNTGNKIYATTNVDKHILVSNDNGVTWNVLYTLPYPTQAPSIKEMRLINNGSALSFIEDFGANNLSKITVLNLESLNVIKQFNLPQGEIDGIGGYSIYDDGNLNTAIMITKDSSSGYGAINRKLYRTTNGGTTWSNIYDAGGLILSDAKIDPQDPQKLYIAKGSGSSSLPSQGGFLKSTNGGANWTETLSNIILESIAIDPQNPNTIYTGTSHFVPGLMPNMQQAVYKTTDGAATWTAQTGIDWTTPNPSNTIRSVELAIDPNNPNHILALGTQKIAVTTNGGSTWTTTFHDGLVDGTSYYYPSGATFNPNNTNQVLIANSRFPKKSNDGGITLSTISVPFFTNMGNIFTVKENNVDKLVYGLQWGYTVRNLDTNQETPTTVLPLGTFPYGEQMAPYFLDKNIAGRNYIFDATSFPRAINVSNDYGATTSKLMDTYDNTLTAVETDPTNPNIAWFGTYNGGTPITKIDFTNTSNPVVTDLNFPTYPYDYGVTGIKINQSNSNIAMVTIGNSIFKTANGGTSWAETTVSGLNLPDYITSLTQNPLNQNQYTITASNGIYTSTDSGNTWNKIYNGLTTKVEHSTTQNGQIIAIARTTNNTPAKVVYSNDFGATWQERNASNYYNTTVLDGAVRFVNATTAEVYLSTYSLGVLKDVINFSTLGTSDPIIKKDDISIYPNPATDIINIKLGKNANFKATLYNTAGQLILTTQNKNTIDVSGLVKGVYLLKIDQENASTIIRKVIKK